MWPVEIANIDYAKPQVCEGGVRMFVTLRLIPMGSEWQMDRNDPRHISNGHSQAVS